LASLRHPCKFQRVSRLGSVTARHSSRGPQPNFAALNRRRHLYSAGRTSRWALAHISSPLCIAAWAPSLGAGGATAHREMGSEGAAPPKERTSRTSNFSHRCQMNSKLSSSLNRDLFRLKTHRNAFSDGSQPKTPLWVQCCQIP